MVALYFDQCANKIEISKQKEFIVLNFVRFYVTHEKDSVLSPYFIYPWQDREASKLLFMLLL